MWTCRCRAEENLYQLRCIISCAFTERTECTPVTCQVIRRRTVACECRRPMPSLSSTPLKSARRWMFSAGLQERESVFATGRSHFPFHFSDHHNVTRVITTHDSTIHGGGKTRRTS